MNVTEVKSIHKLAEVVSSVLAEEAGPRLASNEMRIEIDWNSEYTVISSGLKKSNIFEDIGDMVSFDGPLSFIDVVRNVTKYKSVAQKEKAIARLETKGLDIDGDLYEAEEQAYLPNSLSIKKEGDYTVYSFKLKPKFAKTSVLKNIRIADYYSDIE